MDHTRPTQRKGGFVSMRAPMGTDAFNVEFLLQAAGCLDWSRLEPWVNAVEARLGTTLPGAIYRLHVLASWFRLDAESLARACAERVEFRRFVGAPLHGPVVEAALYREQESRLHRVRPTLAKLVAAVELQLVDHGFFPPTEVLGPLGGKTGYREAYATTLVLPRSLRPVAGPALCGDGAMTSASTHAVEKRAMLVWPWGEVTPVDRRIHIGRDDDYSEFARHLAADRKVSRRHAIVEALDSGVSIQDLGSANGTYIDDIPMRHAETRVVVCDCLLRFGTDLAVRLTFEPRDARTGSAIDGAPVSPVPPRP